MNTLISEPHSHKVFRGFSGPVDEPEQMAWKCTQFVNIREEDRNMPHGTPHRRKGPGRFERESVSLVELTKMLLAERAARLWLEKSVWPDGPVRPYCGSAGSAAPKPNGSRTHRCSDRNCNRWFSVKTGSVMKASHLSSKQWAIGMYLFYCNLVGHSSLHLRRDLGLTQKTAWFLGHRLRKAHQNCTEGHFPVPEDLAPGRGARAGRRRGGHPSREHRHDGPVRAYKNLNRRRESVNHSVGEYVRGIANVNGIESFWASVSAGYKGIFTKISKKHMQRYLDEFCHRHNRRTDSMDTVDMMKLIGLGMLGKHLRCRDLIADFDLPSGARLIAA